jgi:hypothetical protein
MELRKVAQGRSRSLAGRGRLARLIEGLMPGDGGDERRGIFGEPLESRVMLTGTPSAEAQKAMEMFGLSPALFVENLGQWGDAGVRYVHSGDGVNVAMTDTGISFQLFENVSGTEAEDVGEDGLPGEMAVIGQRKMTGFSASFVGANAVSPVGLDKAESTFNYQIGEQSMWRSGVASYETVAYEGLYDGIDLHTWGQRKSLKYEFHVAPGADYTQIAVQYEGISGLSLAEDGSLVINIGEGWAPVVDDAPYVYQVVGGNKVEVESRFVLIDGETYGFEVVGEYDRGVELVVDPEVAWWTYIGGNFNDSSVGVAIDGAGYVYVTGYTYSAGWISEAFDEKPGGFVVKFNSEGGGVWSSYLGDWMSVNGGIAVDHSGGVYITGGTYSKDIMFGGYDETYGGNGDGVVVKLGDSGVRLWSSYIGGEDYDRCQGVAVDFAGNVYVSGETYSSGWVWGGYDDKLGSGGTTGSTDGFIVKLSGEGKHVWSSYLGGDNADNAYDTSVDRNGHVYVTGATSSSGWVSGGLG